MMRFVSALALTFTLIAGCRSAQQPRGATAAKYHGCDVLRVYPTTTQRAPIVVPSGGILCSQGSVVEILPSTDRVEVINLAQGTVNGLDCNITFTVGVATYVINAQQSYCLTETGKVKASVVAGNATITKTIDGSLQDNAPGTVAVALH
jgi:hypothetical protein